MDKNSVLYQLMNLRPNEVMNLSKEVMDLIDHYVSEQNAIGSRHGVFTYLFGFSDCRKLLFSPPPFIS